MNYGIISYTVGWVLNIEAACMVLPLICTFIYSDGCTGIFALCIFLCALLGTLLVHKSPKSKNMFAKEGFIVVALSWIVFSFFGCLPFVISRSIPNFIDAVFETVSGLSTTGASILNDVENLPRSILMWRCFTHWIGGMGVLVFLVAILPLFGGSNMYFLKAESPGPSVSKLVPRVKSSAKILYEIYIVLTALEVIFLLLGKMTLYDSLTTAFGTAGTGGFGIRNDSFASFSPYIQVVVTVFMALFGVDFTVYYLLVMRRFKDAFRSDEVRVYLGVIFCTVALIAFNCRELYASVSENLRHSAFQVAAIITTTGFSTRNFDQWPEFSKTILVALMFMGACAGSTGGGIKVSRILILLKTIVKEVKLSAHPKRTYKIMMNGRTIEHETVRAINVFIMSYIAIYIFSMLVISFDNFDFTTNFTAVAATINNIGPGLAKVGPENNFSQFSALSKIMLTFDMLVGRLEIFPILVLLSPNTWKK